MLKPQSTATRELVSLDGLWNFDLVTGDLDQQQPWTKRLKSGLEAPVPASYNDIFVNQKIHDHVGWVCYQRRVRVPQGWSSKQRYFVRIEAATHQGRAYVNDTFVTEHIGGYTPFDAEITQLVKAGEEFRLTIAVNNELTYQTMPPGKVIENKNGTKKQTYFHDFYNYAGLARSVWIYNVPEKHIEDVTVTTDLDGTTGVINYSIKLNSATAGDQIKVQIADEDDNVVSESDGLEGKIRVDSAKLWQPGAAYLYQFRASIHDNGSLVDTYSVATGIRTVEVRGTQFLINNKPFYFTGFGRHEDTAVRGKGHDQAFMVHDFQLMDWIGANSFRTSHYPYAEDVMDYADRQGVVVIDETPAVGLNLAITSGLFGGIKTPTWAPEGCNDATREAHAQSIRELVARDKNHPCVVLWSIANEPASSEDGAREYFEPLAKLTREADPSRPICFVNVMFAPYDQDLISDLFDVICLNRYYGWYKVMGDLASAEEQLEEELLGWQKKYNKPMVMTEYGADTLAGLHSLHDLPWSEEFQIKYYDMYHRVFDKVQSMVGEQVWNFADFQTSIQIFRIDGNKKGIFTRDRKPKGIAHVLRKRWTGIKGANNQKPEKAAP